MWLKKCETEFFKVWAEGKKMKEAPCIPYKGMVYYVPFKPKLSFAQYKKEKKNAVGMC